jgi:hypothetical protein
VRARFAGRCAGCGQEIVRGDWITPIPGEDGWLCEDCA